MTHYAGYHATKLDLTPRFFVTPRFFALESIESDPIYFKQVVTKIEKVRKTAGRVFEQPIFQSAQAPIFSQ